MAAQTPEPKGAEVGIIWNSFINAAIDAAGVAVLALGFYGWMSALYNMETKFKESIPKTASAQLIQNEVLAGLTLAGKENAVTIGRQEAGMLVLPNKEKKKDKKGSRNQEVNGLEVDHRRVMEQIARQARVNGLKNVRNGNGHGVLNLQNGHAPNHILISAHSSPNQMDH